MSVCEGERKKPSSPVTTDYTLARDVRALQCPVDGRIKRTTTPSSRSCLGLIGSQMLESVCFSPSCSIASGQRPAPESASTGATACNDGDLCKDECLGTLVQ